MNDSERATGSSGGEPEETAGAGSPPDAADVETLRKELEDARSKANTYLDLAQRTQADFVNYKRRVEQERGEYSRSARADIIVKILPVLDDLDRAVASLPPEASGMVWAQGIGHIERKLEGILDNFGLKPIEPVGKPFDPWQEEAVGHEPSATYPPETVTRVARAGFTLDGKVVRPAQVLIASAPPESVS